MKCHCGGKIDDQDVVKVPSGNVSMIQAFACNLCGLLHNHAGKIVRDHRGFNTHSSKEGLYHKDRKGRIVP